MAGQLLLNQDFLSMKQFIGRKNHVYTKLERLFGIFAGPAGAVILRCVWWTWRDWRCCLRSSPFTYKHCSSQGIQNRHTHRHEGGFPADRHRLYCQGRERGERMWSMQGRCRFSMYTKVSILRGQWTSNWWLGLSLKLSPTVPCSSPDCSRFIPRLFQVYPQTVPCYLQTVPSLSSNCSFFIPRVLLVHSLTVPCLSFCITRPFLVPPWPFLLYPQTIPCLSSDCSLLSPLFLDYPQAVPGLSSDRSLFILDHSCIIPRPFLVYPQTVPCVSEELQEFSVGLFYLNGWDSLSGCTEIMSVSM